MACGAWTETALLLCPTCHLKSIDVQCAIHARVMALPLYQIMKGSDIMDLMAWDHVQAPTVKTDMIKMSAGKAVKPGPEGKALFQKVFENTKPDFNSSDGTQATKYAGQSLDKDAGGRSKLLHDKLMASGMTDDQANKIVKDNAIAKAGTSSSIQAKV